MLHIRAEAAKPSAAKAAIDGVRAALQGRYSHALGTQRLGPYHPHRERTGLKCIALVRAAKQQLLGGRVTHRSLCRCHSIAGP